MYLVNLGILIVKPLLYPFLNSLENCQFLLVHMHTNLLIFFETLSDPSRAKYWPIRTLMFGEVHIRWLALTFPVEKLPLVDNDQRYDRFLHCYGSLPLYTLNSSLD